MRNTDKTIKKLDEFLPGEDSTVKYKLSKMLHAWRQKDAAVVYHKKISFTCGGIDLQNLEIQL